RIKGLGLRYSTSGSPHVFAFACSCECLLSENDDDCNGFASKTYWPCSRLDPFVEKIDSESLRELTDLRKLDKRLCADRRICVPWRKRFHRPTPQCRCMKCWKLSLSLCAGSFRKIILIRLNQRSG